MIKLVNILGSIAEDETGISTTEVSVAEAVVVDVAT